MCKTASVAVILLAIFAFTTPTLASTPTVGELAPDFTLSLMNGKKVSLADLKGDVVVLNFWATWCAPCLKELPLLDNYYRLMEDKGLRIFAVTTEDSAPLYQLKPLFAKMAIPAVRHVKGPYKDVGALPTNIVIGRDGRVRYAEAGAFDLDRLNEVLIPLLNERPAPAVASADKAKPAG